VSRFRPFPAILLLACATGIVLLAGCAGGPAVIMPGAPAAGAGQDPYGCGIVVTPATAVVGTEVVVSRPATAPGPDCTTLAPGTIQTLELGSVFVSDTAAQTATVTVGADGSFEATMRVPADLRLDRAEVVAIPPPESDCTTIASPDECYLPRAYFTAQYDPDDLAPLRINAIDTGMPDLPVSADLPNSFAVAGPGPTELTLVIFGSGCASRPASYRLDAPPGSLEIVSEVIVPAGQDGCNEPLIPWTTVIEVPDDSQDYRAVTVDNLATQLLD
jgi:hypothetical protein